jgi:hypothetical protein
MSDTHDTDAGVDDVDGVDGQDSLSGSGGLDGKGAAGVGVGAGETKRERGGGGGETKGNGNGGDGEWGGEGVGGKTTTMEGTMVTGNGSQNGTCGSGGGGGGGNESIITALIRSSQEELDARFDAGSIIRAGFRAVKHGRRGWPHPRFFYFSYRFNGRMGLYWKDTPDAANKDTTALRSIQMDHVRRGISSHTLSSIRVYALIRVCLAYRRLSAWYPYTTRMPCMNDGMSQHTVAHT